MIHDVADVEITCRVKGKAMWLIELRLCGRATIAAEAKFTGACNGGDDAGLPIHTTHHMISEFDDEQIACLIPAIS